MGEKKISILEQPYAMPYINEKTIDGILNHPQMFRGHVRTSTGKIYTTDEFKEKSDRVLGKKMP